MFLIRPIIILLVFFGGLYYFKEPLKTIPQKFSELHSPYVESFKTAFKGVIYASSTTVLSGLTNYVPSQWNATTSNPSTGANTTVSGGNSQGSLPVKTPVKQVVDTNTGQSNGSLLPVTSNQQEKALSIKGIVTYTNAERNKKGIAPLTINSHLTKAAEIKLEDMFMNQYFQHVSPSGESVSDIARKAGYEYIVVGENLALGIFAGDDQVIAAWMASPGHKRNILDTRYKDIGVAIGQGVYQGKKQWLIVQQFGKPLSACVAPGQTLKSDIERMRADIVVLEKAISTKRTEVDKLIGEEYGIAANEYNNLVIRYNATLGTLKTSIDTYNSVVRTFNACAGLNEKSL